MDPNEIRKTKKRKRNTPPAQGGLDTGHPIIEQRSFGGSDEWVVLDGSSNDGEVHRPSVATDSRVSESDAGRPVRLDGRDCGSVGDNRNAGRDADSVGLRPSAGVGQILGYVEAVPHHGSHVPLRAGVGLGHSSEASPEQRAAVTIRDNEYSQLDSSTGVRHRLPSSPVGVDEVCMDAMKVISRISAIVDCMDALDYADMNDFLKDLSSKYETFTKNCYIYLTPPECLGDKGGGEGSAPR